MRGHIGRSRVSQLRTVVLGFAMAAVTTFQSTVIAHASNADALSDQQAGELETTVKDYPDVFGGMWGDPTSHLLTIRVVPASVGSARQQAAARQLAVVGTGHDPRIETGPKKWSVRYSSAEHSLATLEDVASKIKSVQRWVTDTRDSLVSWYIDPRLDRVVIGLTQIAPTLSLEAQTAFGGLVSLTIAKPAFLLDRLRDYQNYYGSDRVISGGTSCTAGTEVKHVVSGVYHYGMLTAGHCWSVGTVVQQGYYSGGTAHTTGNMGKATVGSWGNNVVDAEFLDSTATGTGVSPLIWTGPQSNPPAYHVTTQGISFSGESVCFDGSFTAENCNGIINATNMCVQFSGGYYECHLDQAYASNGSQLAQGGDSGGPVESSDGYGGLVVYGTITGSDTVNFWFSNLAYELNALGAYLVTG